MPTYKNINKDKGQLSAASQAKQPANSKPVFHLADNRAYQATKLPVQRKSNTVPEPLKSGIEKLSGHSMDDVSVHYNSSKPAQLNAHAYAQGTDIHLEAGQEKYLPHEAWHVVQQKQGRVRSTMQMKGKINVNDDNGLEKEADTMGAKALTGVAAHSNRPLQSNEISGNSIQFHRGKIKKGKKKKNKRRKNKNDPAPQSFNIVEHYLHKLPQAWDLATSFRRQRMLITSTLTRTYLHGMNTPAYKMIAIETIKLLHPNSLADSKTNKRYQTVLASLEKVKGKSHSLSQADIARLIPSDEEIQIAKIGANDYISLQGVGRIVAMREAAKTANKKLSITVATYDLTAFPFLPGQIDAISKSYHIDESAVSRLAGALLTTGSIGLAYLSAGKVAPFASWLSGRVYELMENYVEASHEDNNG